MEKMRMGDAEEVNAIRVKFLEGKQELSLVEQAELTARREELEKKEENK